MRHRYCPYIDFVMLLVIASVFIRTSDSSRLLGMEAIKVSRDQKGFVYAESGNRFIPWGHNYASVDSPNSQRIRESDDSQCDLVVVGRALSRDWNRDDPIRLKSQPIDYQLATHMDRFGEIALTYFQRRERGHSGNSPFGL